MFKLDARGVFVAIGVLAICAPALAILPIGLALAGQALLGALNLLAGFHRREPTVVSRLSEAATAPRFSVHLATHQEPPSVVCRTLLSLAAQVNAPEYEVIVLDNNTTDPALWRPVEHYCRTLGARFRFFHEEGVRGAKAGALNIALERTNPDASHIIIVDADYVVEPRFLAIAAEELRAADDDFLQFPQAYRNDDEDVSGLSLELADYFLRHACKADVAGAMLLTGTLSVIRRQALEHVGGWNGGTITEDAELGLRLRRAGFRGRFVDRPVGRGLLPLDLPGLCGQRYRWAAGNLATIGCGLGGLPLRAAVQVFSQLTAWVNLALPLTAGLVGGCLSVALGHAPMAARWLMALAGLGLVLVYLSVCLPLVLSAVGRNGMRRGTVLGALSARVTMILPSALGTVDALLGRAGAFRRTAKDAADASDAVDPVFPLLAAFGVVALLLVPQMPTLGVIGLALLTLPYPLAIGTRRRLSGYRATLQPA